MQKKLAYWLATISGVGYCPFASGTAGSLVTVPLAWILAFYYGVAGIIWGAVIVFFAGTAATKEVLKYTKHDPSIVVIDEMAGQLLSFALVANHLIGRTDLGAILIYLIGFGLFRLFDITKPQPAKWADTKVLNAWGVMLDDVFAGVYAALVLWVINLIFVL